MAYAQPTVLGTQLVDGSYSTHDLTTRGAVNFVRLQATSTGSSRNWEFATGTAGSTNYSVNWRPYTSSQTLSGFDTKIDPSSAAASARYNSGFGGQSGLLPSITSGNYYTVIVGQNSGSNNFMSILETTFDPVSVSSVSHVIGGLGAATTVSITTASSPNASENIYVRYSTDGFTSSSFVQATGSGTSWSASIPDQGGTSVTYYVMTVENGITPTHDDADFQTLEINNNSGSNYSFQQTQVANLEATGDCSGVWSDTDCWSNSTLPTSSDDVLIRFSMTVDTDAEAQSVELNAGTLTASDGSARNLTLTRSSAGTATTMTNSGGTWANGSGGSTVVFTGAPSSGDAIHQTSGTFGFQNVTINKTGGSSNVGVDFQSNASVSGTLQIGEGGFVSTAPPSSFYGGSAILQFNQGGAATYDVNTGDFTWSTTEIPQNITISSGTVNLNEDRTATGDLVVSNSAALNLAANIELTVNTDLSLDGTITLNSTSSGYSQLKVDGTVSGSGSVTAEQHIQHEGWHNMAMPLGGNLNQFGTVNTSVHANARNIYTWDESSTSWVDVAGATDGSSTAGSVGTGYMVYAGTNGVTSTGSEIDMSGSMTTSITPSLTNSGSGDDGGWNFIGNPFTCDLDFFALSTSEVANGYSIWNQNTGVYSTISGLGSGNVGISPMQGFWVDATGASPSLGTITMASHGATNVVSGGFLKTQNVIADRFYLEAYPSNNPVVKDNYLVAMIDGATDGRDLQWDMRKRMNAATAPSLMSIDVATGKGLAVNAIDYGPNSTKAKELQMRFAGVDGETYFIQLDDALLTHNYNIVLEDLKLRRMHDLKSRPYKFVHDANAEYRFVLHLSPVTTINSGHTHVSVGTGTGINGGTLVFKIDEPSSATDGELFDLTGKRVASFSYPAGTTEYSMNVSNLSTGIYVMKLNTNQGEEVLKVLIP